MTDEVKALENRIQEYELLFNELKSNYSFNQSNIKRHSEEIKTLYNEVNNINKELAKQPSMRVQEIALFEDNIYSKIRINLKLITELKESLYKGLGEAKKEIKDEAKKEVMSRLRQAAYLIGIIIALVSVIYYDARSDLNELKAQVTKKISEK